MEKMTILHIASPFAFSAPIVESRFSNPSHDHPDGQDRTTEHAFSDATGGRASPARDGTPIDPRDAREALMRTVDLSTPPLAAVSASVDAVMAAYGEDAPHAEDGTEQPTTDRPAAGIGQGSG